MARVSTRQANFAEGDDHAKRFPPAVTPIAATGDQSAVSYDSLALLLQPNEMAALFASVQGTLPPSLTITRTAPVHQMVRISRETLPQVHAVEPLTSTDISEMLALTALTEPGPFRNHTPELGSYLGVRREGKLVAMAGERMRPPGHTEISAVCTHPSHRGHGYASSLVSALTNTILGRNDIPFLHVRTENRGAIQVYEKLGFETRRSFDISVVRRA